MPLLAISRDDILTDSTLSTSDLVFALISIVVALIVARIAKRAVLSLTGRLDGISEELRNTAGRVTWYFVLLVGIGVALGFLGAPVEPLLAAVLIFAVVAALALRGIADNFASGIVLQTRRPIRVGDEMAALGYVGTVRELNGRAVVIETFDGAMVHLPNSKVLDNPIVNRTIIGARRTEVEVRSPYPETGDIREIVRTAVTAAAGVLSNPSPTVDLTGVDPERVTTRVWFWSDPARVAATTTAVIERLGDRVNGAVVVTPPPAPPTAPPPAPPSAL